MLRSLSHLHPLISPFRSLRLRRTHTAKMSLLIPTVDHIVLFKIRPSTDPSSIQSMLTNLRRLSSLNLATQLTVAPVLRLRSAAASDLGFTHLLHSRHRSKPDLAAYSAHPAHLSVVRNNILPICDDILAVDWASDANIDISPSPGSLVRVTLAKPREGIKAAEVVGAIEGIRVLLPDSVKVSCGENFSPERAKGYEVGFVSVFAGVDEAEKFEGNEEVEKEKEKMRMLLESVVVVDFLVPSAVSGL